MRFLTLICLTLLVGCKGDDADAHLAAWKDRLEDRHVRTTFIRFEGGGTFVTIWEFREDEYRTPGWKRLWNNALTDQVGPPNGVGSLYGQPKLSDATPSQVRLSIRGSKRTRNDVIIDDHLETALLEMEGEDDFLLNGNMAFIERLDPDNP